MERRNFIKNTSSAIMGTTFAPKFLAAAKVDNLSPDNTSDNKLKGFIVSDAHFGWNHEQQPAPETQKLMMQRIITRFPDLDVFIDTGDAHHGALKREPGDFARGNWTDIIAGGCNTVPFFYVAGNHEIIGTLYDGDQEWRCNAMGSVSCRPYYSFDIKSIHFVSLPELVEPVYINKESIEWLALDLEINKNKTVILLSHNNIKGTTTTMGEPGYRGLVNSRELINFFRSYPNIISWMHGHNHTFEVIKRMGMLFVSNGRIGGFVPPESWGRTGQGHLGGIYFEITSDYLLVRSYSASEEKFFDEIGESHLSGIIEKRTTFDPYSKSTYSFGAGGMIEDRMIPVFNHHLSDTGESDLFIKLEDSPSINDDPDFSIFEFRDAGKAGYQWLLMGASVGTPKYFEKENKLWKWENPGINLLSQDNPETFIDVNIPDWRFSKHCYYRGAPGKSYIVFIDLDVFSGGQRLITEVTCYDNLGNKLIELTGKEHILEQGNQKISEVFEIPELTGYQIIYNDNLVDQMVQISVKGRFTRMENDILLKKFALLENTLPNQVTKPGLILDGVTFSGESELEDGHIKHFSVLKPPTARMVVRSVHNSGKPMTWLLRQKALEWQVRNATVTDYGDYFEIETLRNIWTFRKEVVIVPFFQKNRPFFHRLHNIQKSRIYPIKNNKKSLKIQILECDDPGIVIIFSEKAPKKILGAANWNYDNKWITIQVMNNSQVNINF